MFEKILIAEDFNSYNFAIMKFLEELKIPSINQVYYCDDALLQIRKSYAEQKPYQLLITDLFFKIDRPVNIESGEELIIKIKQEFPEVKILVFSVENKLYKINSLFDNYNIDGFVEKGRGDIKILKEAMYEIFNGKKWTNLNEKYIIKWEVNDIEIIKLVSKGYSVKIISQTFKKLNYIPNSESYINKRLMVMREDMGAKNTTELVLLFINEGLL